MLHAQLVTGPATRIVTTAEAKEQLRLLTSYEDDLVDRLIEAAESDLDGLSGVLGRALITQSWAVSRRDWAWRMPLPLAPAQSITSITYRDEAGASQTLAAAAYRLQHGAGAPYVEIDDDTDLPSLDCRDDAVTITYVAGYGDTAADVPQAIRHAALMMVEHLYRNRGAAVVGSIASEMPLGVEHLLAKFRRIGP